ncbi:pyridoxamine 5'-phosphate oxidase family protein [Streptomyces sp. NBC_01431]|uniref:pyridoxamine 5'-phosphate oxidase family protein n=1 Tax=Streptomyces sp. NBC_01431 TaxID=2903863 RepID=UPI002E2FD96F|nr:pyridoxamine 5'-phosphate oxidase family protein [Streptomyces sp. NBC_01431]
MRIELDHGPDGEPGFLAVTESIECLLDGTRLLSMATVGDDGAPWSHNAYFAYDSDLHLYCLTRPASGHVRNLVNSAGRVSVTVADTGQPGIPGTRQGLQLQGHCELAHGSQLALGIEEFAARYPAFAAAVRDAARPDPSGRALRLFVFTAEEFKVFDERAFGLDTWLTGRIRRTAPAAV